MRGSYEDDRDESYHSVERYGQGQSGYLAGRHGDDRSLDMLGRNQGYGDRGYGYRGYGHEDRPIEAGLDDRFAGRGGEGYWEERRDRGPAYGSEGYGRQEEGLGQRGGYGTGIRGYGGAEQRGYESRDRGYGREGDWSSYGVQGGHEGFGAQGPGPGHTGGYAYEQYGGEHKASRGHRGKGPVGYQRSDERIREHVCEALTDDDFVDASAIEVTVRSGEVTLSGTVPERRMKRLAEECVEHISGVKDVHNHITVAVEGASERRRA